MGMTDDAAYAWKCELGGWIVVFRVFCRLEAERASERRWLSSARKSCLGKTEPAAVICSKGLAISLAINPAPSLSSVD